MVIWRTRASGVCSHNPAGLRLKRHESQHQKNVRAAPHHRTASPFHCRQGCTLGNHGLHRLRQEPKKPFRCRFHESDGSRLFAGPDRRACFSRRNTLRHARTRWDLLGHSKLIHQHLSSGGQLLPTSATKTSARSLSPFVFIWLLSQLKHFFAVLVVNRFLKNHDLLC